MVELYEILELYCELLLARVGMLEAAELDEGLQEPVRGLIYASGRIEVKEVSAVAALLGGKWGKEFIKSAVEGEGVAEKVVKKLKVTPPSEALVQGYLEEIAATYGVDWPPRPKADNEPENDEDDDDKDEGQQKEAVPVEELLADDGESRAKEELVKATPPRDFGPSSPLRVNPPSPSTDNPKPRVKAQGLDLKPTKLTQRMDAVERKKSPENKGVVGGKIPEVDDLAARFAALKR